MQLAALDTAYVIDDMHNPPHPGEFISAVYLEPFGVSARRLTVRLDVTPA